MVPHPPQRDLSRRGVSSGAANEQNIDQFVVCCSLIRSGARPKSGVPDLFLFLFFLFLFFLFLVFLFVFFLHLPDDSFSADGFSPDTFTDNLSFLYLPSINLETGRFSRYDTESGSIEAAFIV